MKKRASKKKLVLFRPEGNVNSLCESENEAQFACARLREQTRLFFGLGARSEITFAGYEYSFIDVLPFACSPVVSQTDKLPENVCVHIIM